MTCTRNYSAAELRKMSKTEKISVCGINIDNITYTELSELLNSRTSAGEKTTITYANADTINRTFSNPGIARELNSFDIVHPDGIGIFIASKILFGKNGLRNRFTGSDFYPFLMDIVLKNNFSLYFFGETDEILSQVIAKHPDIEVSGKHNGYDFNNDEVVADINSSKPDILIVGLGREKQNSWILSNHQNLNCSIIIAVGEGIREIAGEKKRGPVFMRKIGLEWLVRFLHNPIKHFKRYIIGNPLFLCRIITLKLRNLRQ